VTIPQIIYYPVLFSARAAGQREIGNDR